MVHIGDTEKRYDPNVIRSLLPLLDDGDILTHYFTANPGGVLDANGRLVPEAREAAARGCGLIPPMGGATSALTSAAAVSIKGSCRTASALTLRCRGVSTLSIV